MNEFEKRYRWEFREKFKTITVDNCTKFFDYKWIEKSKIEPEFTEQNTCTLLYFLGNENER